MIPFSIYGVFDAGKCLYAGCTTMPRTRERAHRINFRDGEFRILRKVEDRDRAAQIESQIIKAFKRRGQCAGNKQEFAKPVKSDTQNPFRKRSFNMTRDNALMFHAFNSDRPGSIEAWHINKAIENYLTDMGYAERLPELQKLFP